MKKGDLFILARKLKADAIVIPTNGYVRKDGRSVMGAGIAKQAADRYGGLDAAVGELVNYHGNHVNVVAHPNQQFEKRRTLRYIVIFPVKRKEVKVLRGKKNIVPKYKKRFRAGNIAPGWMGKASLKLIERSAKELKELTSWYGFEKILIPKPGCGNGGRTWPEVRAIIKPILKGKQFIIVDRT